MARQIAAGRVLLALAVAGVGGRANAAPDQMLNKTVTVSFSVLIPARGSDGSTRANPRAVTRTIYVSSQGRAFMRAEAQIGGYSRTIEKGPGQNNVRISGNSLIGVMRFPSGASQLTVNFDPSFTSCTAQILMGAESGKPIVYTGLDGLTYTQMGPAQVSGVSCAVRAGNAFAN